MKCVPGAPRAARCGPAADRERLGTAGCSVRCPSHRRERGQGKQEKPFALPQRVVLYALAACTDFSKFPCNCCSVYTAHKALLRSLCVAWERSYRSLTETSAVGVSMSG